MLNLNLELSCNLDTPANAVVGLHCCCWISSEMSGVLCFRQSLLCRVSAPLYFVLHVDKNRDGNSLSLGPLAGLRERVSFCPRLLVQVDGPVPFALVDLTRNCLLSAKFILELLQGLCVVNQRPLLLIVERRERIWLGDLAAEAQIFPVVLRHKSFDFDPGSRLEHVQSEHVR